MRQPSKYDAIFRSLNPEEGIKYDFYAAIERRQLEVINPMLETAWIRMWDGNISVSFNNVSAYTEMED